MVQSVSSFHKLPFCDREIKQEAADVEFIYKI